MSAERAPRGADRPPVRSTSRLSRTVTRGVLVLAAFPVDGSYRRVIEVVRELGMGRSTTYRYVAALAEARLLEQDPETRRYRRAR